MFHLHRLLILLCIMVTQTVYGQVTVPEATLLTSVATHEQAATAEFDPNAGRVLVLFTHPTQTSKLWAGTAHGGLWKSDDLGASWQPASELMKGQTVNSLIVDPVNADVMYAGTGEGRSNDADLRGHGMYKSIDGGVSWSLLPLTDPAVVGENWSHINHIAMSVAGVMLAATSDNHYNGYIYRSVDGGKSWGLFPVYSGSLVGPKNMIFRVKYDPANPNTALFLDSYANVTHSTDGGISWKVVKKSATCQ
jgi:photosystem II stability/assembly factor-like uncharacterized protein